MRKKLSFLFAFCKCEEEKMLKKNSFDKTQSTTEPKNNSQVLKRLRSDKETNGKTQNHTLASIFICTFRMAQRKNNDKYA